MSGRILHLAVEDELNGNRIVATCKMSLAQFEELTDGDADAGANLLLNVRELEQQLERTISIARIATDNS